MSTVEQPKIWLKAPPPVWAIVSILVAWGLNRLFDWTVVAIFQSHPLAWILIVGGFALGLWGIVTFRSAGTEIMPTSPTNAKLVTHGPFRHMRNPMYTGLVMICVGIAFYVGTLPFFLTTVALWWFIDNAFIPFEEAKMARQYGPQYADYRATVRRWI